jgi:two-component system, OmpR family, sensor histidine kinase KdpD
VISGLTVRNRQQTHLARHREKRTSVLYRLSRDLATHRGVASLVRVATQHVREVFDSQVAVFVADASKRLVLRRGEQLFFEFDSKEEGVVQWVFEHSEKAGLGTDTLPGAGALYVPLIGTSGPIGVLAVRPTEPERQLELEQQHLLDTLANQIALAIERARLAEEAQQAHVLAETERMRNAILSSVSHDLRTPLATIAGAASSLLESRDTLTPEARQELIRSIYSEGNRLDRLVRNLLDMMRIEAGAIQLRKDWHPFEEIVGAALSRLEGRLGGHPVQTQFPPDLPLMLVDGLLIEQVLINLFENALKFSPPAAPIEVSLSLADRELLVEVADHGPGIPDGEEHHIFEKFYRVDPAKAGGVGLGLTICRGIVEAHGGRIWVEKRVGGGAVFRFTLPLEERQPTVEAEEPAPHTTAS